MRIEKISIEGLFNIFDNEIPLNLDDQITIVHAPNGYGKTVILKMIYGLFNLDFSIFQEIPFQAFKVFLDDNSRIEITQRKDSDQKDKGYNCTISFRKDGLKDAKVASIVSEKDEKQIDLFPDLFESKTVTRRPPEWFEMLRERYNVYFIQTQPLVVKDKEIKEDTKLSQSLEKYYGNLSHLIDRGYSDTEAVAEYSESLISNIRSTLAKYATISQNLDRTFPTRLVSSQNSKSHITVADIESRLKSLEEKRKELQKVGLWDESTQIGLDEYDVTQDSVNILGLYIEDVEQKLSIFDDLAKKIKLFRTILNDRFLYKKVSISSEKGFIFSTDRNEELSPKNLSSGEQHELVLLYQLIFEIPDNAFILIDEPEISLHIVWQAQFLNDLQEIIKLRGFDVLIATHSPQIINDRWDLTVELKGKESREEVPTEE